MNAPIENPFADYFSHLAASFGEDPNAIEVISKASALVGEKAREALLSMDYHCELHLTPAQMYDEKTIVLEQGYHYFIAEMSADQTAGNPIIPFFVQVEDNGNEVELSGGPNDGNYQANCKQEKDMGYPGGYRYWRCSNHSWRPRPGCTNNCSNSFWI